MHSFKIIHFLTYFRGNGRTRAQALSTQIPSQLCPHVKGELQIKNYGFILRKFAFISVFMPIEQLSTSVCHCTLRHKLRISEELLWEPVPTLYIKSLKVLLNKTQIIEEMFSCSIFVSTILSLLNYLSLFLTFSVKIFLLCHVCWQGNCSCITWGSNRMDVIKQGGKRVLHNTSLYRHTWVNMETKNKKPSY